MAGQAFGNPLDLRTLVLMFAAVDRSCQKAEAQDGAASMASFLASSDAQQGQQRLEHVEQAQVRAARRASTATTRTARASGRILSYIEVTKADIALANRLAHEVLGRTLDELPPQTRNLLVLLRDWVGGQCRQRRVARGDVRFTRRELRKATAWGDTQLKVHLARLVELEHVLVRRRGTQYEYELVYDASQNDAVDGGRGDGRHTRHLNGLLDVHQLDAPRGTHDSHGYDVDRSDLESDWSVGGRPLVDTRSDSGREGVNGAQTQPPRGLQPAAPTPTVRMHKEPRTAASFAAVVAAAH